jgi:hypothetical protein
MEKQTKMVKLGAITECTPHGNSYDATDISKVFAEDEAKKKAQADKDKSK